MTAARESPGAACPGLSDERISGRNEIRPPPIVGELTRAPAMGRSTVISTTHHLATSAGHRIFQMGGNAIDAGVAAGIVLNVVEPHMCSFGGVAPIMMMTAEMSVPETIDGVGTWPAAIPLSDYLAWFGGDMPIGIERSVVPGAPDAWMTALARRGSLSFADVAGPAIELCMEGFPAHARLVSMMNHFLPRLKHWPSSMAAFLPDGRPLHPGKLFRQPDLGSLLELLADHERRARASGATRSEAISSARDAFYKGPVAQRIASFMHEKGWPLKAEDLAGYRVEIGEPASTTYHGYDVHACGPWSQGPMIPIMLNLLEPNSSSPSSTTFFHQYVEALKLAAADREGFFGDPRFVDVPMLGLLNKAYAEQRRREIDGRRAFPGLPHPGDPWNFEGRSGGRGHRPGSRSGAGEPDTSFVCAMDTQGNAFSATPSDHAFGAPVVEGLGILVSPRGGQFWLDEGHPAAMMPGKRPRLTPNPAIVTRAGKPLIAFGSPGEDTQTQAMVQFLCHRLDFALSVQAAIEAPRVSSISLPASYYPHAFSPSGLIAEDSIAKAVLDELRQLGHNVGMQPKFSYSVGAVCATEAMADCLMAGADPRRDCLALGW